MIPDYFEFFCPVKILFGKQALDHLPYESNLLGITRPLVVTDAGVVSAGLLDTVRSVFKGSGITVEAVFDTVPPDSSMEIVREAARRFKKDRCDALIALGGGSAMDTAKAVNIVVSENANDLAPFAGADALKAAMKPFAVIPTTAGTGSETTGIAVIKDTQRKLKLAFSSPLLYPKIAVLDPRMTLGLPPYVTAATGMDALTHAVEAFVCLQKNPLSDTYAETAVRLIGAHLPRAVKNGKDINARMAMAAAAAMAGVAFSNSLVGMVHALGHATGAVCDVPHGVAMSVFLPFGLEYNLEKTAPELARLLLALGGPDEYLAVDPHRRAFRTIARIRQLQQTLFDLCGLPRTLREAGVAKNRLEAIAERAVNDASLIFSPREMDVQDALCVLRDAYE